jgi:hypothetical protein
MYIHRREFESALRLIGDDPKRRAIVRVSRGAGRGAGVGLGGGY